MSYRVFALIAMSTIALGALVGAQEEKANARPAPAKEPKIIETEYEGIVIEISKEQLIIRTLYSESSDNRLGVIPSKLGQKPQAIKLSKKLQDRQGGAPTDQRASDPHELRPSWRYTTKDLKPCDIVMVLAVNKNGIELGEFLKITRRPGGQIPMAPGEKDYKYPYHRTANELQEFEEKGTPIPGLGQEVLKRLELQLLDRKKHIKAILDDAEKREKKE